MASTSLFSTYKTDSEIDFRALSLVDSDFEAILKGNRGRFDWNNPAHLKQLTASVLKKDFSLKIELPDDRLCPPVPVRYNYVRWIQDLIATTNPCYDDAYNPNRRVAGLDIGVGASNIYSLLILRTCPAWKMYGTDIDDTSFEYAVKNTDLNNMNQRMNLLQTKPDGPVIPLDELEVGSLEFVMCNPPFFSSTEEMQESLSGSKKSAPPSAVCTGAEVEMITEGGDLGFVLRMIEESATLKDRVQWYSSMLGKLESLKKVVEQLKDLGINNWAVCSLSASNAKTKRWAVAWSWIDYRPENEVARRDIPQKELNPFPTRYSIPVTAESPAQIAQVCDVINDYITSLDIQWEWKPGRMSGVGLAKDNVWSRSSRRKRRKVDPKERSEPDSLSEDQIALAFKIVASEREVVLWWLKGTEQVLWESFCGAMHRRLRSEMGE